MRSVGMSFGIVCTTAATFVVESRRCHHDSAFFRFRTRSVHASSSSNNR